MSIELTATSYLVLGLLEVKGPATPYDLKQRVAATVGAFWSFPHSQLYAEPSRLARAGLVTEEREETGRRRRFYTIGAEGRAALRAWLAEPESEGMQIRDPGLLKLFFAEAGDRHDVAALAAAQHAVHAAKLAEYRRLAAALEGVDPTAPRMATLRLGLAVEEAYADFWDDLLRRVDGD
jgi:PadR family transcriptional regulator, regulatory protein AphA